MFKSLLHKGRYLGLLLCCLISSLVVTAQTKYKGKVIGSDDKLPVVGASVRVKGTSTGTVTDVNGEFTLTLSPGNSLIVSYIGYQTTEVKVGADVNLRITLPSGSSTLNEVVVTGYGSQRKKDITGSVAVVNVASLKTVPSGNTTSLLQGQAAGVTVTNSGNPGGGTSVNIRGISSIYSTAPLVIIDGTQGTLDNINPNDIESIQVLKDAGAASVYGVRGSNGVVVVTTKKGKSGVATITYDGMYGTQRPLADGFKLGNTQTYMQAVYQSYKNSGALGKNPQFDPNGTGTWTIPDYIQPAGAHTGDPGTTADWYNLNPLNGNPIDPNKLNPAGTDKLGVNNITMANKSGTDWFHEVFKPAPIQSHNITASGGSESSKYLFSLGYYNQQGTLIDTYIKRYSTRINTSFNVGKNIRVGENAYIFYKRNPNVSNNQNEGNAISYIYREPPIIPVYDIMGNFAGTRPGSLGNSSNPVAVQQRSVNNRNNNWDIAGNVYAEVDFLKHFTMRTQFGGTVDNFYFYYFTPTAYENSEGNTTNNSFTEVAGYNSSYTWTNQLSYSQQFGKHSVKAFIATEAITNYGRGLQGGNTTYNLSYDPNYVTVANGTGIPTNAVYQLYNNTLYSQFGQVNYNYDEKYYLSGIVRHDGSSFFAPGHQYGTFTSVTGAWRISKENFLKNVSWLNDLKFRGGYGSLGSLSGVNQQQSNAYSLYAQSNGNANYDITGTGNSTVTGLYNSQIGNLSTTWETDKVTNVGFDATFINNKFTLSVELYKKDITGLLFPSSLFASQGGATAPFVNGGNITNKGIDIDFGYHGTAGNGLRYDIGLNFSHYSNKVVSLGGGLLYKDYNSAGSTRIANFVRLQPGQPMGEFFGYQVSGLFQNQAEVDAAPTQQGKAPGTFRYVDVNKDGNINDADRTFIGNPNPKFTGGLTLGASYKGFDFNAFFYGSYGNKVVNYIKYWTYFPQVFNGNVSGDILSNKVWQEGADNSKATVPQLSRNASLSTSGVFNSFYVENGSYLRLKSLTIGYTIPQSKVKSLGISRIRVYLLANNLFTITKYTGLDPELQNSNLQDNTSFGIDFGNYPANQKIYNVGVNATF